MLRSEAASGAHQGDCADDVEALSRLPHIARQLEKLDPEHVRAELDGAGAWDDDQNLHNDYLRLEQGNGAQVDLWWVLISLIAWCDAQKLDLDTALAEVREELALGASEKS